MELPNIPTDNLYKFIALAGTALTILFLTYPHFKIVELKVRVNSLDTEVAIINFRTERLKQTPVSPLAPPEVQAADIKSRLGKLNELQIDTLTLGGKIKETSILLDSIWYLTVLQFVGSIFGSVMMIIGFALWYLLVQRPVDANANRI